MSQYKTATLRSATIENYKCSKNELNSYFNKIYGKD